MSIRKVTQKERKAAGKIYCDHCKPKKVDAIWRIVGFAGHHRGHFACEEHKHLIPVEEERDLIEADYQTWMRIK